MDKKMAIMELGKYQVVAEAYQADKDLPMEMTVYLYDAENDIIVQDICLVRAHCDFGKDKIEVCKNLIDCLVWSDAASEDYTHKFVIDVVNEEE